MANIVYARLGDARVVAATSEIAVSRDAAVILDIDGIWEFATVLRTQQPDETMEIVAKLVRIATQADVEQNAQNQILNAKDKPIVQQFVTKHNLSLNLVAVLRSFDGKKLLVMYTASDRVDFRLLVREMASFFKMRIEMRQISEREEACFCGGCGVCGQPICCRRFLTQPKQTTIKMAKIQNSALTPNKVNGLCGKLMCCLQYEYGQYQEILAQMPAIGTAVSTPSGDGVVEFNDCLREMVGVRLNSDGSVQKFALDKVSKQKGSGRDE